MAKVVHAGHAANQAISLGTVGTTPKEERGLKRAKGKTMAKEEKP